MYVISIVLDWIMFARYFPDKGEFCNKYTHFKSWIGVIALGVLKLHSLGEDLCT